MLSDRRADCGICESPTTSTISHCAGPTTETHISASTIGRSPPYSAAYATIVSAIPVCSTTRLSSAPKMTVAYTGAS